MPSEAHDPGALRRRIGAVLITLLAALAIVTATRRGVGEHLARQGDVSAALAWNAGSPAILEAEAARLLTADKLRAAARMARRALQATPLNATAVATLASVRLRDGADLDAWRYMQVATAMDPGQKGAQLWLFENARARGDVPALLDHGDRLMRAAPETLNYVATATVDILRRKDFQTALAGRLARDPPWRLLLLRGYAMSARPSDIAGLFANMAAAGSPPTPKETSVLAERLLSEGNLATLKDLRAQLLQSPAAAPLIFDDQFRNLAGPTPLAWERIEQKGGDAVVGPADEGGAGLVLTDEGLNSSGALLRQLIFAPAGPYQLRLAFRDRDSSADGHFSVQLKCVDGRRLLRESLSTSEPASWPLIIPGDCIAQWLTFAPAALDSSAAAQLTVSRIALTSGSAGAAGGPQ